MLKTWTKVVDSPSNWLSRVHAESKLLKTKPFQSIINKDRSGLMSLECHLTFERYCTQRTWRLEKCVHFNRGTLKSFFTVFHWKWGEDHWLLHWGLCNKEGHYISFLLYICTAKYYFLITKLSKTYWEHTAQLSRWQNNSSCESAVKCSV